MISTVFSLPSEVNLSGLLENKIPASAAAPDSPKRGSSRLSLSGTFAAMTRTGSNPNSPKALLRNSVRRRSEFSGLSDGKLKFLDCEEQSGFLRTVQKTAEALQTAANESCKHMKVIGVGFLIVTTTARHHTNTTTGQTQHNEL